MNKLRAMMLFTRVADLGSFVEVAEEMGVSPSMISKEIQKLEQSLNARLIHRSTRKINLTDIGDGYLKRCREILEQVADAEAFILDQHTNVKGKLRINVPMVLGLTDLSEALAAFMTKYPDVEFDVHLGDDDLDLLEHSFDLGFRASSTRFDSSYVGKPLKQFHYHLCCSKTYLKAHPNITSPEDLAEHNCFIYKYFKSKNYWPIGEGVKVSGKLTANNTLFIKDAVKASLGVGFLPSFVAQPELESGALIELLPDEKKPNLMLYALYPHRKYTPPVLHKCIEFLAQWFEHSR